MSVKMIPALVGKRKGHRVFLPVEKPPGPRPEDYWRHKAIKAQKGEWRDIETAPKETTVLTQHEDDLYPVVAYCMEGVWLRETEGPEDTFYGADRHCPLYRPPTHWMPLPEPPA